MGKFIRQTGSDNPFNSIRPGFFLIAELADLDDDGDLDALIGYREGTVLYFENTGSASAPAFLRISGFDNPFFGIDVGINSAPELLDFDNDDDLDLVLGGGTGQLRYFENTGSASSPEYQELFGSSNPFAGVDSGDMSDTEIVDLDGDGDLDLVMGDFSGKVKYFLNNGTASAPVYVAQTGSANPFDTIRTVEFAHPELIDYDGDGDLDAFIGGQDGTVRYFENTGSATTPTYVEHTDSTNPLLGADVGFFSTPTFADLNGDGRLDAVIASGQDRIDTYLYVNNAPLAVADEASTAQNTGVNIELTGNDSDADGDALSISAITQGSNGSVTLRADGVSARYVPKTGFTGFDTFTYTVRDTDGATSEASVKVLVTSLAGTAGNDVPLGSAQADFVMAGDGNDRVLTYAGDDFVDGGRGADTLTGGPGADTLLGGEGNDTFVASVADLAGDSIDGGTGTDTLLISDALAVMPANFSVVNVEQISFPGALMVQHTSLLDLSAMSRIGAGNQIMGGPLASRITGTSSADRITDSAGNDDLRGADGNDTIMAGIGQDTVHGGRGNDTLSGSSSTLGDGMVDTFVFNTALDALTNVDTLLGFEANSRDLIALDSSIFSAIGPTLDAGEFLSVAGGLAADADDRIVFDPATGSLYYDADGSGASARVQFATLGAGLTGTVDLADFIVGSYPG